MNIYIYIISHHIIYHILYHISYHNTSHHISYHITSYHITSHNITSYIISHHITSHNVTSYIVSQHITSQHITSHHISYHITSHHITYINVAVAGICVHGRWTLPYDAPIVPCDCRVSAVGYVTSDQQTTFAAQAFPASWMTKVRNPISVFSSGKTASQVLLHRVSNSLLLLLLWGSLFIQFNPNSFR